MSGNAKDWVCYVCGRKNSFQNTECSGGCRAGLLAGFRQTIVHETNCQKCGRSTIRPLIQVVADRGPTAMWGIRSVGLKHIPKEYRAGLRKKMWICFRCATPDMVHSPELGVRVCVLCKGTVRSSNPNAWCEQCNTNMRLGRICLGCGDKLDRVDYQYCKPCRDKGRGSWPSNTTCFRPYSTKPTLDTNRPMKPGPGGIKSRNRAGMSLIEIKEDLRHEQNRQKRRIRGIYEQQNVLHRNKAALEKWADARESSARWCRNNGQGDEAIILDAEAKKFRDSAREIVLRIGDLDVQIRSIREVIREVGDALRAAKEVHTWRTVIPGQFDRPKRKDEIKHSLTWYPIHPFTEALLESDRLDAFRKPDAPKPKIKDWGWVCQVCYKEVDWIRVGTRTIEDAKGRPVKVKTRFCKACLDRRNDPSIERRERAKEDESLERRKKDIELIQAAKTEAVNRKAAEVEAEKKLFRDRLSHAVTKAAAVKSDRAVAYWRIDDTDTRAYTAYVFERGSHKEETLKVDGFDVVFIRAEYACFEAVVLWHVLPATERRFWQKRAEERGYSFDKRGFRSNGIDVGFSAHALAQRIQLEAPAYFPI